VFLEDAVAFYDKNIFIVKNICYLFKNGSVLVQSVNVSVNPEPINRDAFPLNIQESMILD